MKRNAEETTDEARQNRAKRACRRTRPDDGGAPAPGEGSHGWRKAAGDELYVGSIDSDMAHRLEESGIQGVLSLNEGLGEAAAGVVGRRVEVKAVPVDGSDDAWAFLRYLTLATSFAERILQAGGGVLVLDSGESSLAFVAAWLVKHGHEALPRQKCDVKGDEEAGVGGSGGGESGEEKGGKGGGGQRQEERPNHGLSVEEALGCAGQAHARAPGAALVSGEVKQQLVDFHRGVGLLRGRKKDVDALPRLSFAPQFEHVIADGRKAATTRMLACTKDKLGPVSVPGALCVGSTRAREFGILVIRNVRDMQFAMVDDELARIENMGSARELQDVLRRFYPDITDSDGVRVIFFSLLVMLPDRPRRNEEVVMGALAGSREPVTGKGLAQVLGFASQKEVNPALYKLEREGKVVRAGMQGKKPLWALPGAVAPA